MLLTMAACTQNKPSQQAESNKTEVGDNKLADCDIIQSAQQILLVYGYKQ